MEVKNQMGLRHLKKKGTAAAKVRCIKGEMEKIDFGTFCSVRTGIPVVSPHPLPLPKGIKILNVSKLRGSFVS